MLTPVYTPTRTDERNVSRAQVFFGGISVFLEQQVPLFRHTPRFSIGCGTRLGDQGWRRSGRSRSTRESSAR